MSWDSPVGLSSWTSWILFTVQTWALLVSPHLDQSWTLLSSTAREAFTSITRIGLQTLLKMKPFSCWTAFHFWEQEFRLDGRRNNCSPFSTLDSLTLIALLESLLTIWYSLLPKCLNSHCWAGLFSRHLWKSWTLA